MLTVHSVHNTAETVGVLPQGAKTTIICTLFTLKWYYSKYVNVKLVH